MSMKNKWDEYNERQEAKRYFRSQNDQFLDSKGWVRVILLGLITSIAVGVVLGLVVSIIHITSMWFYLIAAYIISNAVTRVSGIRSVQMGICAAGLAILSFTVVNMTVLYYPFIQSGLGFSQFFGPIDLFISALKVFVTGNIFSTIIALIAVFIAYQQAQ